MIYLKKLPTLIVMLSALIMTVTADSTAGMLDDFENDATEPKKESRSSTYSGNNNDDNNDSDDGDTIIGCIGLTFDLLSLIARSASDSDSPKPQPHTPGPDSGAYIPQTHQENETPAFFKVNREPGDPLLPYFRFDTSYQNVESDIDALDIMAQGGYGPFALTFKNTRYTEDIPEENRTDELDINQTYLTLRLSPGEIIEVDLGLGVYTLEGNHSNSGAAFTVPILIYPNDNFGLEFRPAWTKINGNSISDFEVAVHAGISYFSAKAGYRWVESPTMKLNGPFAGITVRF